MESDAVPLYVVGLTYNLKKGIASEVEDLEAEYDDISTVHAIRDSLKKAGLKVELIEADENIFYRLQDAKPDIVFNIAEGLRGRGREAQIPAILTHCGIPFTGSDETTLCIALDKALTKRLLASYRIKTPRYKVIDGVNTGSIRNFNFPLIVKPNAEGSSKGISEHAIVKNPEELKRQVRMEYEAYGQQLLVEEFIRGREFTVGIIGNGSETRVLPPMEIVYNDKNSKNNIYSYNVKKNYEKYVTYVCPPNLDKKLLDKIERTSGKIYEVLQCKDFSRIDFRMDEKGELYFIEINPLPGLAPGYSDYPMLAGFSGIGYNELILMILNSALKRYGMKTVNV